MREHGMKCHDKKKINWPKKVNNYSRQDKFLKFYNKNKLKYAMINMKR